MSEPQRPQHFQIPTRMPEFSESSDNTDYANVVNVGCDGGDFCLTFLRRPRPLSLNVDAIKAGEVELEMNAISRVYLPIDVARGLCQALGQNLAALDQARNRSSQNGGSTS